MLWGQIMPLLLWRSMISKNKIKLLRSLKLKKYREQNQKTLLEGVRLIDEAINSNAQIHSVFATEETLNSNQRLAEKIQSHHILLDMIDQGILANTIELVVAASKGNLDINAVVAVASGCCKLF